jgi:hypothetical protein
VEKVREWTDEAGERPPPWSQPLDWRAILNGGYLHLLKMVPSFPEPLRGKWEEVDRRRQDLVDHLRGTVELSEFQRAAADVEKLQALEAEVAA